MKIQRQLQLVSIFFENEWPPSSAAGRFETKILSLPVGFYLIHLRVFLTIWGAKKGGIYSKIKLKKRKQSKTRKSRGVITTCSYTKRTLITCSYSHFSAMSNIPISQTQRFVLLFILRFFNMCTSTYYMFLFLCIEMI